MRVGFLTPEFVTESYFSGGLANYLYRVSKALIARGHDVHVITLSDSDHAEFDYEGIRVSRIAKGVSNGWFNSLTRNTLRSTITCLALSYRLYSKLKQLHRQMPFDVVQFSNYCFCGLFADLLLNIPSMVRISTYSPVWHEQLGANRSLDLKAIEWLESFQLRRSRHIYAPSYTLKAMVEQVEGVTQVEVIRTPCYVETIEWDTSVYDTYLNNKTYMLFFGRFQLHKGFHILAQALPQVLKVHPECTAVFVVLDIETPLASSMKEYARSFCQKDTDRLVFIDPLPHKQLYPIIRGARIVVLPSLVDNFPNTCLEAMSLGKPVVGTKGASFEELITEGETGFLVPVGDVKALGEKINEVWIHPRLEEIGEAAQRKIQEFTPEQTVQKLLAYCERILSKR
jgi:glycosyltransferase involved in cell wall biosynthesis